MMTLEQQEYEAPESRIPHGGSRFGSSFGFVVQGTGLALNFRVWFKIWIRGSRDERGKTQSNPLAQINLLGAMFWVLGLGGVYQFSSNSRAGHLACH